MNGDHREESESITKERRGVGGKIGESREDSRGQRGEENEQ